MTTIEWVRGSDGSEGMSWNALRAVRTVTRNLERNGKVRPTDVRISANHCEHVNEACRFCYADRTNARLGGLPFKPGHRKDYTFEIDEKKLLEPLRRKKPTRIFVESMSDAFGEWWPDSFIDKLYEIMGRCPHHTFINLSKRPERRRKYLSDPETRNRIARANAQAIAGFDAKACERLGVSWNATKEWPLPNVIEGTSASNQDEANEFGNSLFRTQASVRVLSLEPLLGPIDIREIQTDGIGSAAGNKLSDVLHWVIVGGESGPKARPMHPQWARDIRDQCQAAGVPFFFKQWGEWIGWREAGAGQWSAASRLDRHGNLKGKWLGTLHRGGEALFDGRAFETFSFAQDGELSVRLGKKAAGRLLDGREWNEFPKPKEKEA